MAITNTALTLHSLRLLRTTTIFTFVPAMILLLQPASAQADDPPSYSSVVRWDFYDSISDGILDNSGNGRSGTAVSGMSSSSDTPKGTGSSLRFNGSAYVYGQAGDGDFFDSSVESKTRVDYSTPYYRSDSDSCTISLWVKQTTDELTGDSTLFYHGAGPGYYFTCGVNTNQPSACRGFAVMLHPEVINGETNGWLTVGSPDGGAFTLTNSNKLNSCASSVNLVSTAGTWHHVVVIYSAELTEVGASYNTIVFVDGDKCGQGLIPQPFTDVGGPNNDTSTTMDNTSLWYFGAKREASNDRYSSGNLSSGGRFNGWLDEVRVYEHVLSPSAVTWLKNNTGD